MPRVKVKEFKSDMENVEAGKGRKKARGKPFVELAKDKGRKPVPYAKEVVKAYKKDKSVDLSLYRKANFYLNIQRRQ